MMRIDAFILNEINTFILKLESFKIKGFVNFNFAYGLGKQKR